MIGIGPFSVHVVAVALAAALAWFVARCLPRSSAPDERRRAASLLVDALLVGLVAARLAYVVRWWPEYIATPLSMVSIGDGGFVWWIGLPVALLYIAWRTRPLPRLRSPAVAGIATGIATWAVALGGLGILNRTAPPLPSVALSTLAEQPATLAQFRGSPLVVNLWATWCPPCQREMPALEHAARSHPGVTFVLVNQGEQPARIVRYLQDKGLQFDHVLLDPGSRLLEAVHSRGLPTTLFYAPDGHLLDAHVGEISGARLADNLQRYFAHAAARLPSGK